MPAPIPTPADRVVLRPLLPGETAPLHRVHAQLSPASAHQRYHGATPRLGPRMVRRLAAVVPGRHQVVVAEIDGVPVGLGHWVRYASDGRAAEIALEVADRLHRRGIGGLLLAEIARSAAAAGVRELHAYVLPGNDPVIALLTRYGARRPLDRDSPYRIRLPELLDASPVTDELERAA